MMFLVSEVHPFLDGNGRVARVMLNAELVASGESKIMIPTVFRDDYIGALRRLTRRSDPGAYIRMMERAREFSANVYGDDRKAMEAYLTTSEFAAMAFASPHLYRMIVGHLATFNTLSGVDYSRHAPATIQIIPPDAVLAEWKDDYATMIEEMIYEENKPSFEELMVILNDLNKRINALVGLAPIGDLVPKKAMKIFQISKLERCSRRRRPGKD